MLNKLCQMNALCKSGSGWVDNVHRGYFLDFLDLWGIFKAIRILGSFKLGLQTVPDSGSLVIETMLTCATLLQGLI